MTVQAITTPPVMTIGMDPHKRSNTVVVLNEREHVVDRATFSTDRAGWAELDKWASRFPKACWAIEGSRGMGRAAAQLLASRGDTVVDVPPQLAARTRLFSTGSVHKNDDADAYCVAVAALRTPALVPVQIEDHSTVLKVLSDRRAQLASARNQEINRLHRILSDLVPGGTPLQMSLNTARTLRRKIRPTTTIDEVKKAIAGDHITEIARLDRQLADITSRITTAVQADPRAKALTGIFGIGPVNAALIIGEIGPANRFGTHDQFATWNGTAPRQIASSDHNIHRLNRSGNRRVNHALHIAAVVQTRHDTAGRTYYQHKLAEGKGRLAALRCLKRRISNTVHATITNQNTSPGGQPGTTTNVSVATPNPDKRLFDQATPGPATTGYPQPSLT